MSKNKIIGIILIVVGVLLLLAGKFFILENKNTKSDINKDIILGKQCLNNICVDNLKISNNNNNTRITGDIVNNNSIVIPSGKITIRFTLNDNKTKILEYDFLDLEPNSTNILDYTTTIDGYDKAKSYKILSIN